MNVLVVSPHPDDESLGAGGTIFRLLEEGNKVYWLNVTTIENDKRFSEEMVKNRRLQLDKVQKFYNFNGVYHLNYPTTKLEQIDSSDAIDRISKIVNEVKPKLMILPDYNDAHSDHKIVFEWCYACSKSFRFSFVKQIVTMEIISETDFGLPYNPFIPNFFVDISNYMERKLSVLKIYDTELGELPFPRNLENIKALAMLRGTAAGVKYAEGFRIIKYILD